MRASTELFLYDLLFAADTFLRPSWYNVLGPDFDSWAWRKGLTRRLAQLHRQRLVEPHPALATETARIVRLTEAGRLAALGGRDPVARWRRPWDRRWRVVLFDLPRDSVALRSKLHRLLRARHFGFLQGSVWVSPDPIDDWPDALADAAPDPEGFIVIEGRPATGESDAAMVRGAWDFAEINRRYDRHLDHLRLPPPGATLREEKNAYARGGCENTNSGDTRSAAIPCCRSSCCPPITGVAPRGRNAASSSGPWPGRDHKPGRYPFPPGRRAAPRSVNIRPAPRQPPPLAPRCLPSACQTLPHVWQGLVRRCRADRVHGNKRKGSA